MKGESFQIISCFALPEGASLYDAWLGGSRKLTLWYYSTIPIEITFLPINNSPVVKTFAAIA